MEIQGKITYLSYRLEKLRHYSLFVGGGGGVVDFCLMINKSSIFV